MTVILNYDFWWIIGETAAIIRVQSILDKWEALHRYGALYFLRSGTCISETVGAGYTM